LVVVLSCFRLLSFLLLVVLFFDARKHRKQTNKQHRNMLLQAGTSIFFLF